MSPNKFSIAAAVLCVTATVANAQQYCAFSSNFPCGTNEYVSQVTIGTLTNASGCSATGYQDFTSQTINLVTGVPTAVSVNVSGWYSAADLVTVFADWNGNGTLNDAGEIFPLTQAGTGTMGGTVNYIGTITPPVGALPASRLRVVLDFATPVPCGPINFGEAEDYTFSLGAPSGLVAVGAAGTNPVANTGTTLLAVTVSSTTPPTPPTGVAVTIDLSAIGLSSTQPMFDDGSNGDAVPGDNVFSLLLFVPVTAPLSTVTLPFSALDSVARTAFGAIVLTIVPGNDECANALPLGIGSNGPFSNNGATNSAGYAASCGVTGSRDLFFVFSPACSGTYTIDTCNGPTSADTILTVYGSCGGPEIACNNDAGGSCGLGSSVTLALNGGSTYLIRVASVSTTSTVSFPINVQNPFAISYINGGPGTMAVSIDAGPSFGGYAFFVTFNQGAFPHGWFYGLDIAVSDIVTQLQAGFPFVGPLDGCGHFGLGPFSVPGFLTGLTIYSVAAGLPAAGLGVPAVISQPVSFLIP